MAKVRKYLLFDHIKIHGANAISSPITYGFPSIGGFLGAIHALNRKIKFDDDPIYLDGVLIASHQCDVQVYRASNFKDYTFKLTRNSIGKDGKPRSIIEEGKVHLDISLVVEVRCGPDAFTDSEDYKNFEDQIKNMLMQQRIAGGSVLSIGNVKMFDVNNDPLSIIKRLVPAFVLVNASQDLKEISETLQNNDPEATPLDALIETAKLTHKPVADSEKWQATSVKHGRGWLVPIHLGYQGISPIFAPSEVKETRDNTQETHFVEAIYGLGKWVFSYRLTHQFQNAFWRYETLSTQENNAVYLYKQNFIQE